MQLRLAPLSLLLIASTQAGEPDLASTISAPANQSPWRVGAGYAQILGLKTEFNGLGRFRSPFTPQPLGGGIDYNYDDGYVHVDSSGNAGGQTWNWSYNDNAQYNPAGTGSINFSITNSVANGRAEEDGGAKPGVELFAYYEMGNAGFQGLGQRQATWGFRAGLQYSRLNISNQDILTTGLTTTTDSFDLGGTIPPLAPYTGSFGGPGPLLGDSPTRTITNGGTGLVNGSRELDVDLTLITLGSYLEIPVSEKFNLQLEAGLSLGVASGNYEFHSATTIGTLGTQQSHGRDSDTKILPGAYLGFGGSYQLTKDFSLIGSGRYQYLTDYELGANGSRANLSFDSAFILSLGGVYSF